MPTFNVVSPTLLNQSAPAPSPHSKSFCWAADASHSRVSRAHCFQNPLSKASWLETLTTRREPSHTVHITNLQCRRRHWKPGTQYTLKCAQWIEISPHRWCSQAVRSLPNTRLSLMNSFVSFRDDYTIPHILKSCQCFCCMALKVSFQCQCM